MAHPQQASPSFGLGTISGTTGDRPPQPLMGHIDNLFYYLWQRNSVGRTCPGVRLPDTVVFKFAQPHAWYFTSAVDGSIKRKNRENVDYKKIYQAFTNAPAGGSKASGRTSARKRGGAAPRAGSSGIVAYHVSSTGTGDGPQAKAVIEYFDEKGLHDFLFHREKGNGGFLQKFVEPKGGSNSMIRAVWSPQLCLMERRVNTHRLGDNKLDLHARAVTFEGAEHFSNSVPFAGNSLASQVRRMCINVVDHLEEVLGKDHRVNYLELFYKTDANDRVQLLWCSSLRFSGKHPSSFNREPAVALSASAQQAMSRPPIKKETTFGRNAYQCPGTFQIVDDGAEYLVTYKAVILHHQMDLAKKQDGQQRGGAMSSEEGISVADDEDIVSMPVPQRASAAEQSVPPILKRIHPSLTAAKFQRLRSDPAFLYKTVRVSEELAIKINEVALLALNDDAADQAASRRTPRARGARSSTPGGARRPPRKKAAGGARPLVPLPHIPATPSRVPGQVRTFKSVAQLQDLRRQELRAEKLRQEAEPLDLKGDGDAKAQQAGLIALALAPPPGTPPARRGRPKSGGLATANAQATGDLLVSFKKIRNELRTLAKSLDVKKGGAADDDEEAAKEAGEEAKEDDGDGGFKMGEEEAKAKEDDGDGGFKAGEEEAKEAGEEAGEEAVEEPVKEAVEETDEPIEETIEEPTDVPTDEPQEKASPSLLEELSQKSPAMEL